MKVVGKKRLFEFCARHPELRRWVSIWVFELEVLDLRSPEQLFTHYPSATMVGKTARFLGANRRIELEVVISFALETVCVRFVKYHEEKGVGSGKSDVA